MGVAGAAGAFSMLSGVASSYAQSEAIKSKAEFDKIQAEGQQRLAELQAEDTLTRGQFEANKERKAAREALAQQRAAAAASGVVVDYGTIADLERETKTQEYQNADMIEANAWRQAWGYRLQASTIGAQSRINQFTAEQEAKQTIITGATRSLNQGVSSGAQVASYRNPNFLRKGS